MVVSLQYRGSSLQIQLNSCRTFYRLENLAKLSRIGFMRSLHGVLTWPIFSLTSGSMISDLVRQGISPKTVIDVGANIGQFAVAASKLFGGEGVSVHSFEPNPDCVPILRRIVTSRSGVSVHTVAVGECPNLAALNISSHSHSSELV